MKNIYVIGGANIDMYAKSEKKIIPYDSNIGDISFEFGGVARNIAENIRNLGGDVNFVSAIGYDAYGEKMVEDLTNKGINIDLSFRTNDYNSSTYLAILDENDMYVAINDMKIIECIDTNFLETIKDRINEDDLVILESNLNKESIDYICDNFKGKKVADAISCNKVMRLKDSIGKLDIIKLNKLEADMLNGGELKDEKDILLFTRKLNTLGTKEVLISYKNNLYIGKDNKLFVYKHDGYKDNPVNVSGAGDALLSGYCYSRFKNKDILDSASVGMALSILTVDDIKPVTNTNVEKVYEVLNTINISQREVK